MLNEDEIEEFKNSIEVNNILNYGKILYNPIYNNLLQKNYLSYYNQGIKQIKEWLYTLKVNDYIDVSIPPLFNIWYCVKLLKKIENITYYVHYVEWNKKCDNIINLNECYCLPRYSMTKQKKIRKNNKKSTCYYVVEDLNNNKNNNDSNNDNNNNNNLSISISPNNSLIDNDNSIGTYSGPRTRGKRSLSIEKSQEKSTQQSQDQENSQQDSQISISQESKQSKQKQEVQTTDVSIEPEKKKYRKKKKDLTDDADWICAECGEMEASDDSDLLLCEGGCKRSFHMLCLGILSQTERDRVINGDAWICDDCKRHRHTCAICHDEGEDNTEVVKCQVDSCGKYYHYYCLTSQAKHYIIKTKNRNSTKPSKTPSPTVSLSNQFIDSEEKDNGLEIIGSWGQYELVKCPLHFCALCSDYYFCDLLKIKGFWKEQLRKCYRCPTAFHTRCIPPDCRYNDWVLLCGNHLDEALPSMELPICSQTSSVTTQLTIASTSTISTITPTPIVSSSLSSLSSLSSSVAPSLTSLSVNINIQEPSSYSTSVFAQLQLPSKIPNHLNIHESSHFRLPISIKNEIDAHPPSFKLIFKNDYDSLDKSNIRIPTHSSDVQCSCTNECDENCLNRMLKIECCEIGSGTNCGVGNKNCGNRQFTSRQYVKVQPFKQGDMGWGLRVREDVSRGSLIIEYVGEIISEDQMRERMRKQRIDTPNDHDFYIMHLESGIYVDGKKKGNLSRFINHSCNPNCELSRWVVKGKTRIGIFALRDLECDEPLSYDYQFDTKESESFKCCCGSVNCRGTMAPRQKILTKDNLTRDDRQKLIAAGKKLEGKATLQKEEWKRSYTGKNLPGDGVLEIKHGPSKTTFKEGRTRGLFLVRNIRNGTDFIKRRDMLWNHRSESSVINNTNS